MALSLRPYQAEAIDFLYDRGRACLYDEPGLGKTMQSLLAMRELAPDGRILVVATGDAVGVWQDEVRLWLEEEPDTVNGGGADPMKFSSADGFVLTNYSRLAIALTQHWDGVIFDESQMLRNRNTETLFKTVRKTFDNRASGMSTIPTFFLSGTPVVKAAGDVWPMLHIIDKRRWRGYWPFVQEYAVTWQDEFGWHVEGVMNAKKMWAELAPVVLRRLVKDVQPELPPLVRQRIPLRMTPKQAKAYRQLEEEMVAEVGSSHDPGLLLAPTVLARETRLRQLLVCPRLIGIEDDGAALTALGQIAESHNRPFVIFTPFNKAMPFIEARLRKAGRSVIYKVVGGTGDKFRETVQAFNTYSVNDLAPGPILVAQVTMGKGWSVSRTTHECYMLGFDWNNTTMEQAERRLARDGQRSTVFSHYFVHEDSHDRDALDVLAGKKRLAEIILDRVIRRRFR